MNRRKFVQSSAVLALLSLAALPKSNAVMPVPNVGRVAVGLCRQSGELCNKTGHLFIIGGPKDGRDENDLLRRFIDLTGKLDPAIIVLTAASTSPDEEWSLYEEAFAELGVKRLSHLKLGSVDEANNKSLENEILAADGIFLTGGDQGMLMSVLGSSNTCNLILKAFTECGTCIGGTSAGAAAMSSTMIAGGKGGESPKKGGGRTSAGLGFLKGAVIDQHFFERQRLGRLLAVIAEHPSLLGVGIDESTALVVRKGHSIEVIGQGAVTIVDGRNMATNFHDAGMHEALQLQDVILHILPTGSQYALPRADETVRDANNPPQRDIKTVAPPDSLHNAIAILTAL